MTKEERQKLWGARIAEFKASGQSVNAWCTEHNVSSQQLWYWLKKERQQESTEKTVSWLPVNISNSGLPSSLFVRVGEVTIEVNPGFNPKLLLEIVNTLVAQ